MNPDVWFLIALERCVYNTILLRSKSFVLHGIKWKWLEVCCEYELSLDNRNFVVLRPAFSKCISHSIFFFAPWCFIEVFYFPVSASLILWQYISQKFLNYSSQEILLWGITNPNDISIPILWLETTETYMT